MSIVMCTHVLRYLGKISTVRPIISRYIDVLLFNQRFYSIPMIHFAHISTSGTYIPKKMHKYVLTINCAYINNFHKVGSLESRFSSKQSKRVTNPQLERYTAQFRPVFKFVRRAMCSFVRAKMSADRRDMNNVQNNY